MGETFKYFSRAQQRYWSIAGDNRSIARFVGWRDKVNVPLIRKIALLEGGGWDALDQDH